MRNLSSLLVALFLGLAAHAADAPATFKVSGLSFTRPAAWEWVEVASPMRKAQFKVTGADKKESAEVIFFYFGPGNGGGTQANVDRWLSQFQEGRDKINAKVEPVKIGKSSVTYVSAEGTYMSGMPGGPKTPMANFGLLGAVIEDAEGSIFVRLTGPVALAKSANADFKKLVE
ncbi:MAG TPA: hypothetical protein VHH73_16025, partial [Verrucomicrobiae bacterium]|nr:hypothetical protein [Verrucomicrobiae bacterium]